VIVPIIVAENAQAPSYDWAFRNSPLLPTHLLKEPNKPPQKVRLGEYHPAALGEDDGYFFLYTGKEWKQRFERRTPRFAFTSAGEVVSTDNFKPISFDSSSEKIELSPIIVGSLQGFLILRNTFVYYLTADKMRIKTEARVTLEEVFEKMPTLYLHQGGGDVRGFYAFSEKNPVFIHYQKEDKKAAKNAERPVFKPFYERGSFLRPSLHVDVSPPLPYKVKSDYPDHNIDRIRSVLEPCFSFDDHQKQVFSDWESALF
jgi:hypothetical protein